MKSFPAARGFPPTPGRERILNGPLEAEAKELGGRSWEAGEIRMFNHWATGLRSGLLPEGCGVATPEIGSKNGTALGEVFASVLIFGARGRFLGGFW